MALALRSPHAAGLTAGFAMLLGFALAACDSKPEIVCENVGACAHGGDNDWIKSCQDEAKLVQTEANSAGCGAPFDDYFACADSNFDCSGATPVFAGCEPQRAALDACLGRAGSESSCSELSAATRWCAPAPDAAPELAPACTLSRDCQARCYLDQVTHPCAPAVDDLGRFTACAASCPP